MTTITCKSGRTFNLVHMGGNTTALVHAARDNGGDYFITVVDDVRAPERLTDEVVVSHWNGMDEVEVFRGRLDIYMQQS